MNRQIFLDALASLPPAFRDARPYASLLLGSGWNRAVGSLRVLAEVPYSEIAGFGAATVVGHDGRLLLWIGHRDAPSFFSNDRKGWYAHAARQGDATLFVVLENTRFGGIAAFLPRLFDCDVVDEQFALFRR